MVSFALVKLPTTNFSLINAPPDVHDTPLAELQIQNIQAQIDETVDVSQLYTALFVPQLTSLRSCIKTSPRWPSEERD